MKSSDTGIGKPAITCLGFGEAASAFVTGWRRAHAPRVKAYDIKTEHPDPATRDQKMQDYATLDVTGCPSTDTALAGASIVFSLVTADQALVAAESARQGIEKSTLYLDCNSCSPGTKSRAAALIDAAGARYVDVAVMAPVHPALHQTPLLSSGPHAAAAVEVLQRLQMQTTVLTGDVGAASSTKMLRSIVMKGLEALVAECVLAGQRAGVDENVFQSLEATFPGFGWQSRAGYMLERALTYGVRRAAEMREVARTVRELGLPPDMTQAAVRWQQRLGDLKLTATSDDYRQLAAEIQPHLRR